MKAGVAFAGLGAGALGLERAGIRVAWVIEIDEKCRAVLSQHFPHARQYADITEVSADELEPVDLLLGGFPCQDISIAGPRAGLAGSRSGLYFEWARLVEGLRPEWLIVENVTGLLSSGGRRDMGAVLGTLGDLGYGFAYRVLDSQFFGVPQRRRRVFIVGRAGADPRGPAQVLLEREGERRDSRTRSQAGSVVAAGAASSPGGGGLSPVVLRMRSGKPGGGKGALLREDQSLTVATGNDQVLFQPLAFVRTHTRNHMEDGDAWKESDKSLTLAAQSNFGVHASTLVVNHPFVEHDGALYAVRKLTPLECERLQGLPDGWTEGQADTPRYRQIGNAAAVPVVEWIARGIVVEHWNGHLCTPLGIQEVSPELFVHHRAKVPADRQHFLTPFTPAQIRADKARPFLFRSIRSGAAGVLLKADGEIANLFNAGLPSGWGEALLREVVALGGNRVEYFDEPHLAALYRRHGFIEKERYPFDIELIRQDFPDFDPEKYGTPDYVIARR